MSIFKDKTTLDEALEQWPQRSRMSYDEPQSRERPLPGMRLDKTPSVQNITRPRKGHDY